MITKGTADLCDAYADELQVCEPVFEMFGGKHAFSGPVSTVRCFEDNSRVKEAVEGPGGGHVLVVDGGGSRRRALFGGNLGNAAVKNGWAGVIIYGCIRDSAELGQLDLGIRALGTMPLRSDKRGEGERDLPVRFAGVTFRPGDYVYVDEDGVVVAHRPLA
jgi:regulator of ribonuclease activity A